MHGDHSALGLNVPSLWYLGLFSLAETKSVHFLGLREGQRQRSGRKIADVSDLRARGISCELKGKTFCHANIVRKYGSTYGQVCDNGDITLMRMPV